MTLKPTKSTAPSADTVHSFKSKGPVLDGNGQPIVNDYASLMDVSGTQTWLHNEKHSFDGNEVHINHSHAVDMNLVEHLKDEPDTSKISTAPDTAPTTHLETGKSGHKAEDYKDKPVSAMSNTRPDEGKAAKRD